jgi:hypothetical protein
VWTSSPSFEILLAYLWQIENMTPRSENILLGNQAADESAADLTTFEFGAGRVAM